MLREFFSDSLRAWIASVVIVIVLAFLVVLAIASCAPPQPEGSASSGIAVVNSGTQVIVKTVLDSGTVLYDMSAFSYGDTLCLIIKRRGGYSDFDMECW